jgi:L-fucose mutarotase
MLKGISPIISPELLKVLDEMGHGDEIVLGDANFPGASMAKDAICIRADGIRITELMPAILDLFPLDQYDDNNFVLMSTIGDDEAPSVWSLYEKELKAREPEAHFTFIERFDFYDRAKKAYAIVQTGEKEKYTNIILKKGVIA